MNRIKASIDGQMLTIENKKVVAPTRDYLSMEFLFSDEWNDAAEKIIIFENRKTKKKYEVTLKGNVLNGKEFPDEIAWQGGSYNVAVYGETYNDDKTKLLFRITSSIDFLDIVNNGMVK